jgi:hypothetical protein
VLKNLSPRIRGLGAGVGFVVLAVVYFFVLKIAYGGVFNSDFGLDDPRLIVIMAGVKDDPSASLIASLPFNRFRPFADFAYWSAFKLAGFSFNAWLTLGLWIWSVTCTIFTVFVAKFTKSFIWGLGLGLLLLTSRFAFYQVTNATGLMENLATLSFVVFMMLLWGYFRTGGSLRYFYGLVFSLVFLVFTHERFQGLTLVLIVVAVLPLQELPLKQRVLRSVACVIPALLLTGAKVFVWHMPLFVGTGSASELGFGWGATRDHLIAAGLNLMGINWGPPYLVGEPFEAHPQWLQMLVAVEAGALALLGLFVTIAFIAAKWKKRLRNQFRDFVTSFMSPVLMGLLLLALIAPVVVTIRLEQRWLLTPLIVVLLYVSQFSRVTELFRPLVRVVAKGVIAFFFFLAMVLNLFYFQKMDGLFFIEHQRAATLNTIVASTAINKNELFVSEDCNTPDTTSYLKDLLFANRAGQRITITCVGLTPDSGITFVKLGDDGRIHKYP